MVKHLSHLPVVNESRFTELNQLWSYSIAALGEPKENKMSDELDSADFHAVIGYYNIGSLDRQQEIWDRAMPKELTNHTFAAFAHKAGLGADPGKYTGPQPNFEKALLELEDEDPYDTDEEDDDAI
jgi:hypothetical protein